MYNEQCTMYKGRCAKGNGLCGRSGAGARQIHRAGIFVRMAQHHNGRTGRGRGTALRTHPGFLCCGGRETGQDQTPLRAAIPQTL